MKSFNLKGGITIKKLFYKLIFSFILVCSLPISPLANIINIDENKEFNWYFTPTKNHIPPGSPPECSSFIGKYDDYFLMNSEKKILFLTFDEGYEKEGNTSKILDVLKEEQVPAAFFVVKPYIVDHPELVRRMAKEGHLVCNHSSHHPSMATVTNKDKFKAEFTDVEDEYKNLTGEDMPKFFRPPMGKFSINSLKQTQELGYKTIFWSFAYKDWITDQQPSPEFAKKKILSGVHPGGILLLHAVSDTNVSILKDVIQSLKADGYEFKSLNELQN